MRLLYTALAYLISFHSYSQAIEVNVDSLIARMTIEEKVGQMTQINLGFVSSSIEQHDGNEKELDWEKINIAINEFHVGSIFNTNGFALELFEWHEIINNIQSVALKSINSIPIIYGIDAIHGATYIKESCLFPHNISLAASRSRNIVHETAKVTALETRASGIRWNFDPVLDIGREPLWPRFSETYGESAFICGTLGSEVVKVYEGDNLSEYGVASCLKHFIGHSVPKSGKNRTEAFISDIEMWEYHIPPFQYGINAGASSIMLNSSSVNGIPIHASYKYINDLLIEQMSFSGLIITDWEDIIRLHTRHKVASTPREAVKIAINSGVDMSMVPNDYSFCKHLVDLVKKGEISESRLDISVKKILLLKRKLGLFVNPFIETDKISDFGKPEYRKLAREAAESSIILLENEGVLPLDKQTKLFIVGPTSSSKAALNGGWSYSWQGNIEDIYPKNSLTLSEALKLEFGSTNVSVHCEGDFDDKGHYNVDFNKVDEEIVILCLGENAYAESPGGINNLHLPDEQINLANQAIESGKKVVVILIEGRGRIVSSFIDKVDAVILAMVPGSEGGPAISNILSGDVNPSGILPFTYHRESGNIISYDHRFLSKINHQVNQPLAYDAFQPQWEFGHGLSYSDFEVSITDIISEQFEKNDTLIINYQITNESEFDGHKAIDIFVSDLYASNISPRNKVLVNFERVSVPSNTIVKREIILTRNNLKYVNSKGEYIFEPGEFIIDVSGSKKNISLK